MRIFDLVFNCKRSLDGPTRSNVMVHLGFPIKTLKVEVLLICLALSTQELETDWPAGSQDNGLGWDITAYPWRLCQWAITKKTGRRSD